MFPGEGLMLSIKLTESDFQIERKITKALSEDINNELRKSRNKIISRTKTLVRGWLMEQPEVVSLVDTSIGSLASQFGIPKLRQGSVQEAVVSEIVNSTTVIVEKISPSLKSGGLIIRCQPKDFADLLGLPEATVTETQSGKSDLHWLEWLLKEGNKVIVAGYSYDGILGFGRSGGGVMKPGGMWRVPPEFSGTPTNNFITRALNGRDKEMAKMLEEALK
jgi:hypothetical protein